MQSKISFFNPTIYKQNIKRAWPVALFYMLFMIIEQPILMANALSYRETASRAAEALDVFQVTNEVVSLAIASILIVLVVFSYLYNNRHANMMHSFPVSRGAHFGSGVLASLTLLWAAEVIVAVITFAVMTVHNCTTVYSALFVWLGAKALNTVFFVGLAVFCAMFVGQRVSAALLYVIINGLYSGLYLIVYMFSGIFMFGFTHGSLDYYEILTPLYYLSARANFWHSYEYTPEGYSRLVDWAFEGMPVVAVFAVIGLIFIAIGAVAYRFRKVETAGDFISYDWLKPIYKIAAAAGFSLFISGVCFGALADLFGGMGYTSKFILIVMITIVTGFVFFFAVEMLIRRSFRVFNAKQWMIWGIFTIVMIMALFCLKMDIFGFQRRIPEVEHIRSSSISLEGTAYSDDDPSEVVEIHEVIVDRIDGLRDEASRNGHFDYWDNVRITYVTDQNEFIVREYELYPDSTAGGEVMQAVNEIFSRPEVQKKVILGDDVEDRVITNVDLQVYNYYYDSDGDADYDITYQSYETNLQQSRQLVQALTEDIEAGHVRLYGWTNDYNLYDGDLMNTLTIDFFESYSETDEFGAEHEMESISSVEVVLTEDAVNTIRVLCDMIGMSPEDFMTYQAHNDYMAQMSDGAVY